jgi:carbon-monoxide dehydrogenase iron sulfur subunit
VKKGSKGRLVVKQSNCNACMSCQIYCATTKEHVCAPTRSRVRIQLDPLNAHHRITLCRQCEKALCAEACPEGAIVKSEDGNYWEIDYDLCTNCKECLEVCRVFAIHYDPVGDRIIKCDTCESDPVCAQVCPTGALTWVEGKEETADVKSEK